MREEEQDVRGLTTPNEEVQNGQRPSRQEAGFDRGTLDLPASSPSTQERISIEELAKVLGLAISGTNTLVQRNRAKLDILKVRQPVGGYKNFISIASLRQAGLLKYGFIEKTEGNALRASKIIRELKVKGYNDLDENDRYFMEQIDPLASRLSKSELLSMFIEYFGHSNQWYRNEHPEEDGRKHRPGKWDLLTRTQQEYALKLFLDKRNRSIFVEKATNDPDLCIRGERAGEIISQRSWYRIAAKLEKQYPFETTIARKGFKAAAQMTEPLRRNLAKLELLEMVVADTTPSDRPAIWIDGTIVRVAITFFVDMASRMIVGRAIGLHDNSLTIKTGLFDCLVHFGKMKILYMDNGKPYKAYRIVGKGEWENDSIRMVGRRDIEDDINKFSTGVLSGLGIRSMKALPFNPRPKIVERVFKDLGAWMKNFDDYLGNNYWNRPEGITQVINEYRKLARENPNALIGEFINKKTGKKIRLITVEELAFQIDEFIERHNSNPSAAEGLGGLSPIEYWTKKAEKHPPEKIETVKLAWNFLEGPAEPKTIYKNSMHLYFKKGVWYRSDDFYKYAGEQVMIRYNPLDCIWVEIPGEPRFEFVPRELYVFSSKGVMIGMAHPIERLEAHDDPRAPEFLAKVREPLKAAREHIKMLNEQFPRGNPNIVNTGSPSMEEMEAQQKKIAKRKEDEERPLRHRTRRDVLKENGLTDEEIAEFERTGKLPPDLEGW